MTDSRGSSRLPLPATGRDDSCTAVRRPPYEYCTAYGVRARTSYLSYLQRRRCDSCDRRQLVALLFQTVVESPNGQSFRETTGAPAQGNRHRVPRIDDPPTLREAEGEHVSYRMR
jgi:hypothetical protein